MKKLIKIAALLSVSMNASAHGEHDVSSVWAQVMHWLTAPDHMIVLIAASAGIGYLLAKSKSRSNQED